jgi:hypothetical protein
MLKARESIADLTIADDSDESVRVVVAIGGEKCRKEWIISHWIRDLRGSYILKNA